MGWVMEGRTEVTRGDSDGGGGRDLGGDGGSI